MAEVSQLNVGGSTVDICDQVSRNSSTLAVSESGYNTLAASGSYGGRNLATVLASEMGSGKSVFDALHARVAAANFAGLRVGDWVDVTLLDTYKAVCQSQVVRLLLAHVDPYYRCGDTAKGHHLAFVASDPIAVATTVTGASTENSGMLLWNTTDTNQGTSDEHHPYLASNLKAWEDAFQAVLPDGLAKYLLTQRVLLPERYSSSGTLTDDTGWSWASIGKVFSLSEMEVYGCPAWSTQGFNVGMDCQWDIFRGSKDRSGGSRIRWWLRSVMSGSASNVCFCDIYGSASITAASAGWVRPRPGFLLG